MRVSVIKDDWGYRDDAWKYTVFLNGEEVHEPVLTADEETGEIIVARYGEVVIKEKK